jgi:hypothetical protein
MEDAARSPDVLDYASHPELWFDYVADTGDGWDSTYAMASMLAAPALEVGGRRLAQGEFLLLGGDTVYPAASQQAYRERFVAPFETAFPRGEAPKDLLAIPGNHDWYDGLVNFSRRFTQYRPVGAWQTRQGQSYFALKLPHGWWLWGIDVLPGTDMDHGQRQYFRGAAARLCAGDRVILVAAEPEWIKRRIRDPVEDSLLGYVERTLIGPRHAAVHLWLAGDFHHYRRHEKRGDPGRQRITSGGGGAYLAPTHRPGKRTVLVGAEQYDRKATFPSCFTSFRLSLLLLLFALRHWKLDILAGLLYAGLTWTPRVSLDRGFWEGWRQLFESSGTTLWAFVVVATMIIYASREGRWFGALAGLGHGLAHVVCALTLVAWVHHLLGVPDGKRALIHALALFVAGGLVAPTLFGLYLFVSLTLFGRHADHAFSALQIPDYKHFLRLHIGADGTLSIYPIGIRRVPRGGEAGGRHELIDEVIRIPGPRRAGP